MVLHLRKQVDGMWVYYWSGSSLVAMVHWLDLKIVTGHVVDDDRFKYMRHEDLVFFFIQVETEMHVILWLKGSNISPRRWVWLLNLPSTQRELWVGRCSLHLITERVSDLLLCWNRTKLYREYLKFSLKFNLIIQFSFSTIVPFYKVANVRCTLKYFFFSL